MQVERPVKTRLWLLLVGLVLIGLIASGCTTLGTQPKGWAGGEVTDETLFFGSVKGEVIALDASDGSRVWEAPLEAEKSDGGFGCTPVSAMVVIYGTPAVAGDSVYVGAYNGIIYAINITTGEAKKFYPEEGELEAVIGGLVAVSGKLYFGSVDGVIYALDVTTRDTVWRFPTGSKIWSTPVIDSDTLYVGSFDKKLYALDANDGSKRWEPFATEGAIVAAPVVYNDTVYFGSLDRHVYALDAATGALKWRFPAEKWFWTKVVAADNLIYAPCLDGKVYVLNAETGAKVTEFGLGSPISSSPVLVENLVIVATEEGRVYSLDATNQKQRLLANIVELADEALLIRSPLFASEGIVFVHAQTEKHGSLLYALNAVTGIDLWRYPVSSN
ncbi:MAG: PQQ-like beta-propeller repeat protein [Dehalococcoidia bacterium]|nr:MAG: PQQ-like beta-propeller repeat protein [Dehalococcoidia bacterium]